MKPSRIGSAVAVAAVALVTARAHAATDVHATADRATVGSDDTFQVEVAVAGAHAARLLTPAMRDFRIVGQSRATQVSIENGGAPVTTERFALTVQPLRTGTLTFPALDVVDDGRTSKTDPLAVRVVAGHVAPPPRPQANDPFAGLGFGFAGGDPFDDDADLADVMRRMQSQLRPTLGNDDVLVRTSVDNPRPYVGQQTTLSIHLLTRVPLAGVQLTRVPSVAGATSEDVPTPKEPSPRLVTVGGARYQSVLVARKALFPLHAGAIEVPPIQAIVDAGGWGGGAHKTVTSPPLRLTARAVPGRGDGDEAVGQWTMHAAATPAHATAGEPVTIRVIVDGHGELRGVQPPDPIVPAGWRKFPPSTHDTPRVDGGQLGGTRTVETVVVPDGAGRFVVEIPPLPYFDPAQARHESARAAPVTIDVAPAAAAVSSTATPHAQAAPARSISRAGLLRGVLAVFALLLALLGGVAAALSWRRRRRQPPTARAHARRARRHLQLAARLRSRGRRQQLYDELARALRHTTDAVAPPAPEATPLRDRLATVSPAVRSAIQDAVDACDAGRFAPAGEGDDAASARAWTLAAAAVTAAERSPYRKAAARSSLA